MKKSLGFIVVIFMLALCSFPRPAQAADVAGKVFQGDITVLGTAHVVSLVADSFSVFTATGIVVAGPTGVAVTYGLTAATGTFSGNVTAATVNTGQGAYELYKMDQNVDTAAAVSFAGITNTAGLVQSYVLCTDSATLTASSGTVVSCSKATAQSITLPAVSGTTGLTFTIKKTGAAGIVKIITNGSELIDGTDDNSDIKTQYDYLTIVSNGTKWLIVGRYVQ